MQIPDRAHRNENQVRRAHRDALEETLVARWRAGRSRGWIHMFSPSSKFGRVALAAAVVVGLGIAACSMPTESQVEMGKRFSLTLNADGTATRSFLEMHQDAHATLEEIKAMPGVESVNVNVMENTQNVTQIDLMVWGAEVPVAAIQEKLETALAGGATELELSDLTATVKENWASKLGREVLHIDVASNLSDEEARAAILEQLAASGYPNARVGVLTEGDTRIIHVDNVESGETGEGAESLVIEQKQQ
jgi:hypothetical protein